MQPGESVLDVGCGTGTLAIAAARRVGLSGSVVGIDASPQMVVRARWKAATAGLKPAFQVAVVERLPFADNRFDLVLSTMMLHHLPRATRQECAGEISRVLKTGGRVLGVDFDRATPQRAARPFSSSRSRRAGGCRGALRRCRLECRQPGASRDERPSLRPCRGAVNVIGIPAALATGALLIGVLAHLGILAAVLSPFYTWLRRGVSTRSRRLGCS